MKYYTFSKKDKIKSRDQIQLLFTSGKSMANKPLRVVYYTDKTLEDELKVGVSVSKRYFKRAVDRNYIKRLLREVYRKNQFLIKQSQTKPNLMMFLYQSHKIPNYADLELKMIELFEKLTQESEQL